MDSPIDRAMRRDSLRALPRRESPWSACGWRALDAWAARLAVALGRCAVVPFAPPPPPPPPPPRLLLRILMGRCRSGRASYLRERGGIRLQW